MMCPVALLADAMTWLTRAGILLLIRLSSAVVLAAAAFSIAILVAENVEGFRGTSAAEPAILSEVIEQPLFAPTITASYRTRIGSRSARRISPPKKPSPGRATI